MKQEPSDMPRDRFALQAWTEERVRQEAARRSGRRKNADTSPGQEPGKHSEEQDHGYQRR